MKTIVLTSDHHSWLLKGFFRQWIRYAGAYDALGIEVVGFTRPAYMPKNVRFHSIGAFEDYPVNKWSDALIRYLKGQSEDFFMILLEDYWLMRPLNYGGIYAARNFMTENPDVIRFDVAADRMFNRGARFVRNIGAIDLCECKGDYSLSFQASIWNRKLLLDILTAGESPWQSELNGTQRLNALPYRVVGSYQWPMMYCIVMNKGKLDTSGSWMFPARTLTDQDWDDLEAHGCLKPMEVFA